MSILRVIELSRVLAGPVCMILGDLGPTYSKVERPRRGDETRGWGSPFDERGQSAYFLAANRNKKSIAFGSRVNIRDRDVLLSLIAGADIVVENFLPGTLAASGISGPTPAGWRVARFWALTDIVLRRSFWSVSPREKGALQPRANCEIRTALLSGD